VCTIQELRDREVKRTSLLPMAGETRNQFVREPDSRQTETLSVCLSVRRSLSLSLTAGYAL